MELKLAFLGCCCPSTNSHAWTASLIYPSVPLPSIQTIPSSIRTVNSKSYSLLTMLAQTHSQNVVPIKYRLNLPHMVVNADQIQQQRKVRRNSPAAITAL